MKKRKKYTAEFKERAVRLYETSGKTQAQIERDLGLWKGSSAAGKGNWNRKGSRPFLGRAV